MKLSLKCCCCGLEQASMYVPWDETTVNPSSWWTTRPCKSCETDLTAEAYAQGGIDAVAGIAHLMQPGRPEIHVVQLEPESDAQ